MKIAMIGLGRVGTALSMLLSKAGHTIVSAYDSDPAARVEFSKRVAGRVIENLENLDGATELLLIAVPDGEIRTVSQNLAKLEILKEGVFVGHTSGALSSDVLDPVAAEGCSTFSLHPIQTFASIDSAVESMAGSYFAFEGAPEAARTILESVVEPIGAMCIVIQSANKPFYHASLSTASNLLVALLNLAVTLCERAGIDRAEAFEVMLPLIRTTLENYGDSGILALTGPIERADFVTIQKHVDAVSELDSTARRLYSALARSTVEIAREKGSVTDEESRRLTELLSRIESDPAQEASSS
jgi:predicted short-subunit dehydrogenase-like oxidoreductase (DUF2520 family)